MSFNAFTGVLLDTDTQKLVIDGTSREDLGANAHIEVAIVSVAEPRKRCQKSVGNAATTPWSVEFEATCPPAEHGPFTLGEQVYVVGSASSDGYEPFVWANLLNISAR